MKDVELFGQHYQDQDQDQLQEMQCIKFKVHHENENLTAENSASLALLAVRKKML